MGTLFDTADANVKATFQGLQVEAIGAYENGRYANANAARTAYPHAHVLTIDVLGAGDAHAGDFEAGDMPYAKAGPWAKTRIAAGVTRPVIYFSISSWPQIAQSLRDSALDRAHVRLWTAHYTEPARVSRWSF